MGAAHPPTRFNRVTISSNGKYRAGDLTNSRTGYDTAS